MTRFKRTATSLLVAALAGACFSGAALAAAPMAKSPAPGWYRIMLGDFEVTPLSDGTVDLPVEQLLADKQDKTKATLAKHFLKTPLETSDNAFLVNTGSKLVLIDTGAGSFFGPTLGRLVANMKAAGYSPEQVDEIYITHFHGDHVGGLVNNSQIVFPNAVLRASKREADYWLSQANMDKSEDKGGFQAAMAAIQPYVKAGKFKAIEGDVELLPGIRAQGTGAHTPGHMTYVVVSKGEKLVLIGDLIHVAAVQMAEPGVTISFDSDQKASAQARKRAFDAAVKGKYLIGGAHLAFPGLGHLRSEGKGYRFVPVNYTQMR